MGMGGGAKLWKGGYIIFVNCRDLNRDPHHPRRRKEVQIYTLKSTLAQRLVLTLLNNEFVLKILNYTTFRLKICEYFRPKKKEKKSYSQG